MPLFKLWIKASGGRRLNIKRAILFPVIIYGVYVLIDSFMPILMLGFVAWLLYNWAGKRDFGNQSISCTRMDK